MIAHNGKHSSMLNLEQSSDLNFKNSLALRLAYHMFYAVIKQGVDSLLKQFELTAWLQCAAAAAQVCFNCSLIKGWNMILPPLHSSLPQSDAADAVLISSYREKRGAVQSVLPPADIATLGVCSSLLCHNWLVVYSLSLLKKFTHLHHLVLKMSTTKEEGIFLCQFDRAIFAPPLFFLGLFITSHNVSKYKTGLCFTFSFWLMWKKVLL